MAVLFFFSIVALLFTYLEGVGKMKKGLWLGVAIVTFLAAIHYNFGSDYPEYFADYREFLTHNYSLKDILFGNLDERGGEIGWLFLMWIVTPFGISGFYVLVALLAVFQGVVVYMLINKYVPAKWMVFALFIYLFNTNLYVGSMSGLRQNTAMAIIGSSLPLILNKKFIKAFIIILLASLVHKSAFIFLPFAFWGFVTRRIGKPIFFIYLAIIVVLYIFKDYIQLLLDTFFMIEEFQIYQIYTEREVEASYGIGFLVSLVSVFLSFSLIWRGGGNEDVFRIVSLAAISYAMMPIVNNVGLASRIAYYFDFFSMLALPYCYATVKKKPIRIGLLSLFVILYVYSFYNYFFLPERYESTYIYHSLFDLL